MTDDVRNLYEVTNAGHDKFYVVARDEGQAARAAEKAWLGWQYPHRKAPVVSVKLIASEGQYPADGVCYLLV